jgi:RNA polymerase sigma factor (sigma-70 family)
MEELIDKAKKGNKDSFTKLMLMVEKELYHIAKARLKNDDDVYDAIQETIMIAYKNIEKLKEKKYFKTWIIRILINETNLIYKKNKKTNLIPFEETIYVQGMNSQCIERADVKLDFNFICNKLKEEDRTIIIMYYMERFTDKEIGKILNLKVNTIKTKKIRAIQKIKNILEKGRYSNG